MKKHNEKTEAFLEKVRKNYRESVGVSPSSFVNQVLRREVEEEVLSIGNGRPEDELVDLAFAILKAAEILSVRDLPQPVLDALAISRKKGTDYNAAVGRSAYFPLGMASYAQMVYVKALRLVNLSRTGAKPNYESARDTVVDLINYATFLGEAIDSGEV